MADDRLSAALEEIRKRYEVWGDANDVPRLLAALNVVLGHHEPQVTANGIRVCPKCSRAAGSAVRAPCPEVRDVTRALNGEENDGG